MLIPYDTLTPHARDTHRLPAPDGTPGSHCPLLALARLRQRPSAGQNSVHSDAQRGAVSAHPDATRSDTTAAWTFGTGDRGGNAHWPDDWLCRPAPVCRYPARW